jgi:hypothetical protein
MGQRASGGAVFMVNRFSFAVAMALLTGGCASTVSPPILAPIEVKVPVATPVYCEVGKVDRPALPLAALKADSAPADTIRAYAATVVILKGAVLERDSVIAGCVAPASSAPSTSSPDDHRPNAWAEGAK